MGPPGPQLSAVPHGAPRARRFQLSEVPHGEFSRSAVAEFSKGHGAAVRRLPSVRIAKCFDGRFHRLRIE